MVDLTVDYLVVLLVEKMVDCLAAMWAVVTVYWTAARLAVWLETSTVERTV